MRIWLAVGSHYIASVMRFHRKISSFIFSLLFARTERAKIARVDLLVDCGRQSVAENFVPNGYSLPDVSPAGIARVRAQCNGEILFIPDYEIIQMFRKYLAFATSRTLSHDSFQIIHHSLRQGAQTMIVVARKRLNS